MLALDSWYLTKQFWGTQKCKTSEWKLATEDNSLTQRNPSNLQSVNLTLNFFCIPLPSSGDCFPVSGPTTWLMFATPVRRLELSEIWGLFIQICEILLQQWNCVFSPLDIAVFFIPPWFERQALYFTWANFSVSCSKIPSLRRE